MLRLLAPNLATQNDVCVTTDSVWKHTSRRRTRVDSWLRIRDFGLDYEYSIHASPAMRVVIAASFVLYPRSVTCLVNVPAPVS